MKKIIPILSLIVGISAQSCRQEEDQLDSNVEISKITNVSNRTSDSIKQKVELEKDPPVKDGQDWKH